MQYLENEDKRVSNCWNYPLEKINDDTGNSIKTIVLFREKLLSMVNDGLLTEDDYNAMKKVFYKVSIAKFSSCIDITEIMFFMQEEDIFNEINYLIDRGFLNKNLLATSKANQTASLIVEIQGRLLALVYNLLHNLIPTGQDKISYLKKLSDSSNKCECEDVFIEFYDEWVDKSFNNENLKSFLLGKHDFFIKLIKILASHSLKKELASSEDVADRYTKEKYFNNYYKKIAKNK